MMRLAWWCVFMTLSSSCRGSDAGSTGPAAHEVSASSALRTDAPNRTETTKASFAFALIRKHEGHAAIVRSGDEQSGDEVIARFTTEAHLLKIDRAGLLRSIDRNIRDLDTLVLVDLTQSPPDLRAAMGQHGLSVGTIAGDVVTGRATADALGNLAGLSWVRRIEFARAVQPR